MTNAQNGVTIKNTPRKKRGKASSLDRRKSRSGWLFVLPFIIGFVFIYFPMLFSSLKLTFVQADGVVGFQNYHDALFAVKVNNSTFLQVLVEGLGQMIFDIPAIIIFSLFMAILLNQKMAGRALFRAIFFVPVILSTGIMEQISAQNAISDAVGEGMNTGAEEENASSQIVSSLDIATLFANMKIGTGLADLVSEWINNIFNIVNRSGVQMLIFLAGLQSISPAIYESCQIDGASAWETFWKITFPMISPMILVNAVYTVIDSFTGESNLVMSFINSSGAMITEGVRSAMAWMYFLVVILIVLAVAGICSVFVFYQRRND
ncbi:MAG: sugar ABC transporter permease [Ruminococcaceae bacterium]|nr:sugar ABC transporter permease [Oscillospiraceae bacterium]